MKKFGKSKNSKDIKATETSSAAEETAVAGESAGDGASPSPEDTPLSPEQEKAAKKFRRKKRIKKWAKRVIGIILLLALAVGIAWFVKFKRSRQETAAPAQTTSTVTRGSFDSRVTGSGTVQPIESYTLTSLIEGKITYSPFDEGDQVNEGDILYRFDDTEAQTAIQEAQSALRRAQKDAEDSRTQREKQIKESAKAIETAQKAVETAEKAVTTAQKDVESAEKDIASAEREVNNAQKAIAKTNERIAKLTITAPISGVVDGLTASVGDDVSGTLCRIIDYDDISTTVSFNSVQIQQISEGDRVTVGVASLMSSVGGYVEKKYNAAQASANGTVMYAVKIKIDRGTRLAAGTNVSVTVHTAYGDVESPGSGAVSYPEPKEVLIPEAGELTMLAAENGNTVAAGAVIARVHSDALDSQIEADSNTYQSALDTLESRRDALQDRLDAVQERKDAVEDSREAVADAQEDYNDLLKEEAIEDDAVKSAQTQLDNAIKKAEDYVIKSPVTGIVLEKHFKAGDTYGSDSSNKTLMVVADMTTMIFNINVDELDISNIKLGQTVNITADALPGQMFQGEITKASKIGSGESGVTGYPVEISITEPGELMSGMNVTAEIVVGSVEDVLIAPASAIFMIDGMYFATVVTPSDDPEAPEQEEQVQVNVGLHNESLYEIVDGLNEGDVLRDSGLGSDDDMMGGMMYGW